jgi:hypothetical protein
MFADEQKDLLSYWLYVIAERFDGHGVGKEQLN